MMTFSPVAARLKAINGLDADAALAAMGGKHDVYERTVRVTIRLLPKTIGKIDSCIAARDLKNFMTEIHGIKSVLRSIGAAGLGNGAAQLEKAARDNDMGYCGENYPAFKKSLLDFVERVNMALTDRTASQKKKIDKAALSAAIGGVKTAVKSYDAVQALNMVSRLSGYSYNEEIDGLLQEIIFALEEFNCEGAITNINKMEGILNGRT
ncbi:MAG: hypothetical protein LBH95_04900 [Oscillospiraceae bacterium]|nr:hypothetical protein [Oscillospiraceae bacterium]